MHTGLAPSMIDSMNKPPLLTPILRWFMLAMVLANVASAMSTMLIPIYLTELGASIGQVGLVFTLTSVAILFLQIFGGWISDSIGRLRAIAIGSVGGILGFIALLLAPTWQWMLVALVVFLRANLFGVFALSRALIGIGGGLLDPAYQSLISKAVPKKMLGVFSGVFYSSLGLISLPAPWLGAQLWERFSPRLPFFITAVAALLIIIPVRFKFRLPEKSVNSPLAVVTEAGD